MHKLTFRNKTSLLFSLIFVFLFNVDFVQCQNIDSKFILGGNLSLSQSKNENGNFFNISPFIFSNEEVITRSFRFSFNPYIGKVLNPSSLAGIQLSYLHSLSRTDATDADVQLFLKETDSTIGIGFFYRKLLLPKNDLHFYLQPSIRYAYSFGKEEQIAPILIENKGNTFSLLFDAGGIYRVNDKWNLLLQISAIRYSYNKSRSADMPNSNSTNRFTFSPNLNNIRFGIERKF